MTSQAESPAAARREGRARAEAFERALREREDSERIDRLTRVAAGVEDDAWPPDADVAPTELARLKSQVTQLAEFRSAVLASKMWRITQAVRRFFGRAW